MVMIEGVEDLPPPGQVLGFGEEADSLGSEDGIETDVADEVVGGDSEEEAELFESDEVDFCEFLEDVWNVGHEVLRTIVMQDVGLVDVLPASPVVDQSDYVIENVFNLLQLGLVLAQQPNRPLNYPL